MPGELRGRRRGGDARGGVACDEKTAPHGDSYARCVAFWENPGDGTARLVSGGWDGVVHAIDEL